MVINDKLVFIHLQKCGGTFVKHVLEDNFNAKNIRPEHNGFVDIKKKDKNKIIFGTIRNPYSWYVSLYHKHYQHPRSFFKETFKNNKDFSSWVKHFLNIKNKKYHDLDFRNISHMNIGPYSYRAFKCYGTNKNIIENFDFCKIKYLKMENLNKEFSSFLLNNNLIAESEYSKYLNMKKVHTGNHKDYREYYDNESRELVYFKDRYIFQKFNYGEKL